MNKGLTDMNATVIAELARLTLLTAVELAAKKAGVSVEEMCSIIDSNPKGPAAMFVRKLVGLA